MKIRRSIVQRVQEVLKRISVETIGRSIPYGAYEKRYELELFEEVEKMKKTKEE